MQLLRSLFLLVNFALLINALALPTSFDAVYESSKDLFKRKGGGGGGGRGGGSSSSSSSSSSGGSRGSGSSSSGSSSSGRTSSTSNTGGSTSAGSGTARGYGGGAYYGGGAAVPYRAGSSSGRVAPYLIGGAALGILPGVWLYGAYAYSYPGYYHYHNTSANRNESHPVECLCGQYQTCGCDVKNDTSYLNSVANNNTIARVGNVNGTDTLVINGTLDNGTTAPGGSDSAASGFKYGIAETGGIWVIVAGVVYTTYFM